MSLYPSLEDMKVHEMVVAESRFATSSAQPAAVGTRQGAESNAEVAPPSYSQSMSSLYPMLDYMGLDLSDGAIERNMPAVYQSMQVAQCEPAANRQVAPLSGDASSIRRAEIRQGVRPLTLCKDSDGRIGLKVKAFNKGVFITFVLSGSPAALAGIRFGDQIVELNGESVAGWDSDRVMSALKKCPVNGIRAVIRDRPFGRVITLQRDSSGCIGIKFSNGRVTHIVKDSSAARNGVLIDHQLVEVNGQNVLGLKDKKLQKLFRDAPENTVTITIMPCYIYDHIIKCIGDSLLKKMDHSMPDV